MPQAPIGPSRGGEPPPNALVVVAHPDPDSFNHALARAVADCWAAAGCDVGLHDLYADGFDPLLTAGEARGQLPSDPLVQRYIARLREADHLAVVHPNFWGAPPAIMKGWIDRVFALNAAYAFEKGVDEGGTPTGLLRIRSALVVNTGNTPLERERQHFGDPLQSIWTRCVLDYCGVANVRRRLFGVVSASSPADRMRWLDETRALAMESLSDAAATGNAADL